MSLRKMALASIQVGQASKVMISGRSILTAIHKTDVQGAVVVKPLGLDGDEQADPSVHGGVDKAVYAYPSEHYAFWRQPREPCYKFKAAMGFNTAVKAMVQSGFCGFYLAVDEPGTLEAGEAFDLLPGSHQLSIPQRFAAKMFKPMC